VRASVGEGKPLIAFGIIGPPEAGIVAGYDRDGDVLVGYSYFQEDSSKGYYEHEGWFDPANPVSMLAFGQREARPPERETLVSTLRWAVHLARTETHADHMSGLAAYEGWASGFEVNADYPEGDRETLATRVMVHGDQAVMLHDRRAGGAYLRSMADVAPEAADELAAAASLFEQVADTPGIWLWGHDMGENVQDALVDPATRRGIATQIRVAAKLEAQGVEHIESALGLLT
jgi:hypothetical protein